MSTLIFALPEIIFLSATLVLPMALPLVKQSMPLLFGSAPVPAALVPIKLPTMEWLPDCMRIPTEAAKLLMTSPLIVVLPDA